MAVIDDLNRLAALDVVNLRRSIGGPTAEVFRGRLRQSLYGSWVFNASTGSNGAVGFVLGGPNQYWSSSETPATGIVISIMNLIYQPPNVNPLTEQIILTSVIPQEFSTE
jgi:hypothetical protein